MENTAEGSQLHSTNPMENNVSEDCLVMFKEPTPSVVMQDETSYTNLRLSKFPSLILIDEALSAEPLSLEIDQPENDQEQQSSNNELLLQAMTDIVDIIELEPTLPRSNLILSKMPPLVPISQNVDCPIAIAEDDFLLESPTNVILSPETKLLLSEQMRKHVQLLTQMHLFTAQQSALTSVTEECRSMLQDLIPFKQRMGIANLDEALDLVTHWENVVSKSESEEFCRYQRPEGVTFEERQDANFFNSELVEMIGESRVFMYPDLLPKLAIYQTEPGTGLRSFSPYEDQLIAMGIEQFIPFCANLSIDCWYSLDYLVSSMISKHMLPQWTAEQIQMRIMNNCLETSPANPIKVPFTFHLLI
ncbi:hypothetical protein DAPPUDRAFT_304075 [Daphnia pulex]|uniref:Uncharacterized protein n=1 Tax=Daphnia pulex TaxID=6669 RepID=E9GIY4_DAPPU|nr:hypothetical protein DAPPUDRAFT_304075 [Daphnia pulex]|eukprot:EFX80347.1 hypothetical protein DAPPUDRAFT_304075 [Daphnia pulex]